MRCVVCAALLCFSPVAAAEPIELSVVSFNVLVEISVPKEIGPWKDRRDLCVEMLKKANPDLIGLQEPLQRQVDFLLEKLPAYRAVVQEKYPDATLLYRAEMFDLLDRGHWWLSPTPEKLSVGFGNGLPRIAIWARLRHKPSNRELFFLNTHFDNTLPSQTKMATLLHDLTKPLVASKLPLILVGDFNTDQKRGDYSKLISDGWQDSYVASPQASPTGKDDNVGTTADGGKRIDHIFYHGEKIRPLAWRRLESSNPKQPLSDHYPIYAKLSIE